jgi:FkbM family methyltransferase
MDGKQTSTPWQQSTDVPTGPAVRAEGRREHASEQIQLLPGVRGTAIRLGLAVLARLNVLWRFNATVRGSWLGQPVAVPLVFGNGIQHVRVSEGWMYDIIRTLLERTSGAFVDVGANIGQTLLKVKMADRDRAYFGFEPNPVAVAYLQQLSARNHFTHTSIFPVGLSDHTAVVTLFLKDDVDPSASLVTGFRSPERYSMSRGVAVHRGDDVLEGIADLHVGILKIDVEGAELDVIAGCERTIARDQPVIICEVLPVYDPSTDAGRLRLSRQQALGTLLNRLGYEMYRADGQGRLEKIAGFTIDSDISRSNYLFLPRGTSSAGL